MERTHQPTFSCGQSHLAFQATCKAHSRRRFPAPLGSIEPPKFISTEILWGLSKDKNKVDNRKLNKKIRERVNDKNDAARLGLTKDGGAGVRDMHRYFCSVILKMRGLSNHRLSEFTSHNPRKVSTSQSLCLFDTTISCGVSLTFERFFLSNYRWG